jgi:hypothetical protein
MQRRNPERRAQQEMRRIAATEGAGGRYASGPGAGFGGVVGFIDGSGNWKNFGRVGITTLDAPFYVADGGTGSEDPPGRVGITTLGEPFRVS